MTTTPTPSSLAALLSQTDWLDRLAHGLVGNRQVADDLTQDTLVAALERPPRSMERLRPWLATVLRNSLRQWNREEQRRRQREERACTSAVSRSAAETVEKVHVQREVADLVLQLRDPYRTTLLLRYYEQLSEAEIGRRMGVPRSTVATRHARAIDQLRQRLGGEERARDRLLVLVPLGLGPVHRLARWTPTLAVKATSALALLTMTAWLLAWGVSSFRMRAPAGPVQPSASAAAGVSLSPPAPATPAATRRPLTPVAVESPSARTASVDAPDPKAARPELSERELRALVVMAEAYRLADHVEAELWPGFSLRRIPLAVYEPNGRALLVHHPEPPPGFQSVRDPTVSLPVYVGPAADSMDANTSGLLGGKICAFVTTESLLTGVASGAALGLILHEAGHAFRDRAPDGGPARWRSENSILVASYPVQSAENNTWGRMEGQLLRDALACESDQDDELLHHVATFLAVRRERQSSLSEELATFERRLELNEGLAEYFATAAAVAQPFQPSTRAVEVGVPTDAFGPTGTLMRRMRDSLARVNAGGQGAARKRFYVTGAAQGLLLDHLDPGWKGAVEERGATLQDLLVLALRRHGAEVRDDLAEVKQRLRFDELLAEETQVADSIRAARRSQLTELLGRPGPLLVLDLTEAGGAGGTSRFDPMNIVSIESTLRLHTRMLTVAFDGGEAEYSTTVVQDLGRGLLVSPLPTSPRVAVDDETLEPLRDAPRRELHGLARVEGEGIRLNASSAAVLVAPDRIIVRPGAGADAVLDVDEYESVLEAYRDGGSALSAVPRFQRTDHRGETVLHPDDSGRDTVLVFFSAASWARPSHRFIRELVTSLHEAHTAERPVRLLLMASQCTDAELDAFLADVPEAPGIVHDGERIVMQQFGVQTFPTIVNVDRSGAIVSRSCGYSAERVRQVTATVTGRP